MSSESHGVLTERTSCAIHAFLFLWPEIVSWFPFQIVLWTFYQYEVIVRQYIILVIQAIQSSVCKAEAPKSGFQKMGDQKIESLCVSWWSLLLVVFLFGWLLFLFYWSEASSSATPVERAKLHIVGRTNKMKGRKILLFTIFRVRWKERSVRLSLSTSAEDLFQLNHSFLLAKRPNL